MTFDSLLIHEIYKKTPSSSQNALGEWIYIYVTSTTAIKCRCSPVTGKRVTELQGFSDDIKYQCFMGDSEDVSRGDYLIYASEEYRVKELIIDSSTHHITALLARE